MFSILIMCRVNEVQSRPRREYTPKPRSSFDYGEVQNSNGGYAPAAMNPPAYSPGKHTYVRVGAFCQYCLWVGVYIYTKGLPSTRRVWKSISF